MSTIGPIRGVARALLPKVVRASMVLAQARMATAAASVWDRLSPAREPWAVPPARLRYRVQGAVSRSGFLSVGHQCADDIRRCLREVQRPFESFSQALDFGCGVGRVMRWLGSQGPRLQGVDIDPEAVAWCKQAFPFAAFEVTPSEPPLPFADAAFDLIYGISVFTHLDEALQHAWLRELRRVIRDNGVVLLTIHGPSLHGGLSEPEQAQIARNGFVFRTEITGRLKPDGLPDFYQSTFHTRQYIEQRWTEHFRLIGYVERGMANYQDVVLLTPR